MASIAAQLHDVLAIPMFIVYSLKIDPLTILLALTMLAYIFWCKATGFTARRYVEEIAPKYGTSAETLRIILGMADTFDLWTNKASRACMRRRRRLTCIGAQATKLVESGSYLLFIFDQDRQVHLAKQIERVSALEHDNAELREDNLALDQENTTLRDDNTALERDNAGLSDNNAVLMQDNMTLTGDNAALRHNNVGLATENAALRVAIARLEKENATCRTTSAAQDLHPARERKVIELEQEVVEVNRTTTAERSKHAGDQAVFIERVSTLTIVRDELLEAQDKLAAELESTRAPVTPAARASDGCGSATEDALRAKVADLKQEVERLREQREVHLADDSARTIKHRAGLAKVTAERDAAVVEKGATERALVSMTAERDVAVAEKLEAAAQRDFAVTQLAAINDMLAQNASATRDAAEHEKCSAIAQRDEEQRVVASGKIERDAPVAETHMTNAELDAAVAACATFERALVAMTLERDAAVAEKEAAIARSRTRIPSSAAKERKIAAAHKVLEAKCKELTKVSEMLTSENKILKEEMATPRTSCDKFKTFHSQIHRVKTLQLEREEYKDAHNLQLYESAANKDALKEARTAPQNYSRKLAEKDTLVDLMGKAIQIQLTLQPTVLAEHSDDVLNMQQRTPPASPDRDPNSGGEHCSRKQGKTPSNRLLSSTSICLTILVMPEFIFRPTGSEEQHTLTSVI
ncbi:hypothetical protein DICSQDRAFT_129217 [Dichomitus squalens LYAD-421 SS1]|uniref:Uncharacterized protein n=1 Tax=Dichomitus squalens (strain LYAD-421) TaxID=732165 RepID=R7SP26_DICSQ|nr:uncharacterized protein DICSQDRAFT_129217 [Dichomitus squalens LYAD-421 SS1]EJF57851.1 hypothetical protein DICSQDRAFT_129217 [Dichomitus squalens LYAD-421 SS1]